MKKHHIKPLVVVLYITLTWCQLTANGEGGSLTEAKITRCFGDIATFSIQLKLYKSICGALPTSKQGLAALARPPQSEPVPESWKMLMEEIPLDPWGHEYIYSNPATRSSKSFDLYSLGPDGEDGTADDIGNWQTQ